MLRVYIAGPISKDPLGGTRAAIEAASALADLGCAPYVPHLCVLWEISKPRKYEDWMRLGFEWLASCDALLRLPGESAGADAEVGVAEEMDIPVFHDLVDVRAWVAKAAKVEATASNLNEVRGLEDAAFSAMAKNIRQAVEVEARFRDALRSVIPFAESRVEDLAEIAPGSPETIKAASTLEQAKAIAGVR